MAIVIVIIAELISDEFQSRIAEKRIDIIVKLTEVEKKLEEKYKSNIELIAG